MQELQEWEKKFVRGLAGAEARQRLKLLRNAMKKVEYVAREMGRLGKTDAGAALQVVLDANETLLVMALVDIEAAGFKPEEGGEGDEGGGDS